MTQRSFFRTSLLSEEDLTLDDVAHGSSSLALSIVGEPYGCHALQRLRACSASPDMLLFRLAFAIG